MYTSIRNHPSMYFVNGKADVLYAIRMREKYGINTVFNYEDIENAGFKVLDCAEGGLCDSVICEDNNGNVVIFAETALNEWCSALIPIRKSSNAETWDYWYNEFVPESE